MFNFCSLINMCLGMFLLGFILYGTLVPLGLDWLFPFPCWGHFQLQSLQKFSHTLFFCSSGTPIIRMLMCLILYRRSLRLSSAQFFSFFFTLFCSSEVIPSILSSSSLTGSSASDILLLIPSRVFLISVIVLVVSVCLFFNFPGLC